MKRWMIALVLLAGVVPAAAQDDATAVSGREISQLAPEIVAASGERMEWLSSFGGVSFEGLFRVRMVKVPADQAPRIVYDTRGVYDSGFKYKIDKNKTLVVSERIGNREKSATEVTVYYHTLDEIRIRGAEVSFDEPIEGSVVRCSVAGGALLRAAFDAKDLALELTGRSVAVLSGAVRYGDFAVSTGRVDASLAQIMSLRIAVSGKAEATIAAPERLEASFATKGRLVCVGRPELLHLSNALIGGEIVFEEK
ncbi:MAG: DUF2807 domain-containing protein [Alistipes sp.]|nr:DUF2807 domain-containing protein [Alistipes sp.]